MVHFSLQIFNVCQLQANAGAALLFVVVVDYCHPICSFVNIEFILLAVEIIFSINPNETKSLLTSVFHYKFPLKRKVICVPNYRHRLMGARFVVRRRRRRRQHNLKIEKQYKHWWPATYVLFFIFYFRQPKPSPLPYKMSHTILLVQPSQRPETRTYSDYESVNECMEGVCKIYEEHLKRRNPNTPTITYDISQLFDFVDQVRETEFFLFGHL